MVVPEVAPVTTQEGTYSWVAKVGWKFGGESGRKVGKKKRLAVNTESMKAVWHTSCHSGNANCVSGALLSTSPVLADLSLTAIQTGRYYYPHFTGEMYASENRLERPTERTALTSWLARLLI